MELDFQEEHRALSVQALIQKGVFLSKTPEHDDILELIDSFRFRKTKEKLRKLLDEHTLNE